MEHMMFKGSPNIPTGQFSRMVSHKGGEDNAFTGNDYTAYYEMISKDYLPLVMQMEADRMRSMTPNEADTVSERNVVMEERRQRTDNNPEAQLTEQMLYSLYPNHPYGRPAIGWMSELPNMTRDDVVQFHDTWYAPNNAIVVISGDSDFETVTRLATQYYGDIPRKELPNRTRPKTAPLVAPILSVMEDQNVVQPQLQKILLAPSWNQDPTRYYALLILEEILAGGSDSLLYQKLVVQDKKAINISVSYRGDTVDDGDFWINAYPTPKTSLPDLERSIMQALYFIAHKGLSPDMVTHAKTRIKESALFDLDNFSNPAQIVGRFMAIGMPLSELEGFETKLDQVTPEQVIEALKTVLIDNKGVSGYLLPKTQRVKQ
jgi:zinc protease